MFTMQPTCVPLNMYRTYEHHKRHGRHGRAFYKFLQVKNLKVKKIVFRFGAKLRLILVLTKLF